MKWEVLTDVLVWSVQAGWKLLGRPVNVAFTDRGLGYTHPAAYGEPVYIYINPTVLEKPNGVMLLQALILHEIGHHTYHFSDPAFKEVHMRVRQARLHSLFNLIIDEHMERRLRARDAAWGESLDALASFAFRGEEMKLFIQQYADLMGFEDRREAARALVDGQSAGRILQCEQGYRLEGMKDRWVSFGEFLDMLIARMQQCFKGGILPSDIDQTMSEVHAKMGDEYCLKEDALLKELWRLSLFERGKGGSSKGENSARVCLAEVIEKPPEEVKTPREYVDWLESILNPYLESFPGLQRFIDEMARSVHSEWFWNKRNTMLWNMRRKYDFTSTFLPANEMSNEELEKVLGQSVFDPVRLLDDMIKTLVPVPQEHSERPGLVSLSWTEALAAPHSDSMIKFKVSLGLGLGDQFVRDDPKARDALKAIPRGLRKLEIPGLWAVTQKVAEILGDSVLDETRGRQEASEAGCGASGQPGSEQQPADGSEQGGRCAGSAIGGLLSAKQAEGMRGLNIPLEEDELDESMRQNAKKVVRDAARRIDNWLRTGKESDSDQEKNRSPLKRGGKSTGYDRFEGGPTAGQARWLENRELRDLLNVAETLEFDPITESVVPKPDREVYQSLVAQVRPDIRRMRRYLAELGQSEIEVPASRSGRRLDPGRVRRLAVMNQPDVLFGSETRPAPDLFLGICIDCSSSMSFEDRMDKAKSFAALLLEASARLPGIDCFALGFTDDEILEVGRPGSAILGGLEPCGGNNDAAGLLALALHAQKSARKKRLLVMISDGYPTGCSLDSLGNLVRVLEHHWKMRCVQVAVDEMDEERIVFPRFTDLTRHEPRQAVRAFGRMIRKVLHADLGF